MRSSRLSPPFVNFTVGRKLGRLRKIRWLSQVRSMRLKTLQWQWGKTMNYKIGLPRFWVVWLGLTLSLTLTGCVMNSKVSIPIQESQLKPPYSGVMQRKPFHALQENDNPYSFWILTVDMKDLIGDLNTCESTRQQLINLIYGSNGKKPPFVIPLERSSPKSRPPLQGK